MEKRYFIPVSAGLLEDGHYGRMGIAVWTFMWLIDRTTKEFEESGQVWGTVLGGKPIKAQEIADCLGIRKRAVNIQLKALQGGGYIKVKRAPYGLIVDVAKSKKRSRKRSKESAKNRHSIEAENARLRTENARLRTESARFRHSNKTIQDNTGLDSNKESASGPPSKEEINESSIPKVKNDLEKMAIELYERDIFPKAHAFKNQMLKQKRNPRAILHAFCRCLIKRPPSGEEWGYCLQIMKVEDGNYNERDYQKTT